MIVTVVQMMTIASLHEEGKFNVDKKTGCLQSAVSKQINGNLTGRKEWLGEVHK